MSKLHSFNYILRHYLLRIALFLALLGLGFHYVNRVMTAKEAEALSPYYYDYAPGSFDVIFAGPSLMKNGIQPVELWNDYGIASYNLACGNQALSCSYYILKDAISRDHPQLVVLDVTYAEEIYLTRSTKMVHYLTDQMPLTDRYRYSMIRNLVPEEDRMEFYLPFYSFHSRWKELTATDFANGNYQKDTLGSVLYAATVSTDAVPYERYDVDTSLSDISREYLNKIIALCKDSGTELLFICCPAFSANGDCDVNAFNSRRSVMQDVAELAAENDITFLNFLETPEALNLDLYQDFWDGVHLNMFGSAKLTSFIGSYIRQNYDQVPDRSSDSAYVQRMDHVATRYVKTRRAQAIKTVNRLDVCLEVLRTYQEDDDLTYEIALCGVTQDQLTDELRQGLASLGFDSDTTEQNAADTAFDSENTGVTIAVYTNTNHKLIDRITISADGSTITHFSAAGE